MVKKDKQAKIKRGELIENKNKYKYNALLSLIIYDYFRDERLDSFYYNDVTGHHAAVFSKSYLLAFLAFDYPLTQKLFDQFIEEIKSRELFSANPMLQLLISDGENEKKEIEYKVAEMYQNRLLKRFGRRMTKKDRTAFFDTVRSFITVQIEYEKNQCKEEERNRSLEITAMYSSFENLDSSECSHLDRIVNVVKYFDYNTLNAAFEICKLNDLGQEILINGMDNIFKLKKESLRNLESEKGFDRSYILAIRKAGYGSLKKVDLGITSEQLIKHIEDEELMSPDIVRLLFSLKAESVKAWKYIVRLYYFNFYEKCYPNRKFIKRVKPEFENLKNSLLRIPMLKKQYKGVQEHVYDES